VYILWIDEGMGIARIQKKRDLIREDKKRVYEVMRKIWADKKEKTYRDYFAPSTVPLNPKVLNCLQEPWSIDEYF
jgi:hypothetical protein